MRIILVSTSFEDCHRSKTVQKNSHYPIGVAYLHSFLEQAGHQVETLFLNDYPYEDCFAAVRASLEDFKPDFVGFNILTPNRISSFKMIEFIHQNYAAKILVGGIHTSVLYEQLLKKFPYVIAVLGEGEETTRELIEVVTTGKPLAQVQGIAYNEAGEVVKTEARPLIDNLDSLPFPKHEIFFSEARTMGNLLTSRGCPFKCSFCVLDRVSQQKVRYRSVKNVVDEIEYMVNAFPQLQTIWIHDDNFFLKNQRAIEICEEIVRRNIHKRFICSGRFKPFSKELVEALEKAGFVQILFGLESGSETILESCHKCITRKDVIAALKILRKSKIEATAFLIVGLYGENDQTVKETIEFVKMMQRVKYTYYDDIGVILTYPGTEIYDIALKNRMMDDSYWLTDAETPIFTVEHSEKKLFEYKGQILDSIALRRFFSPTGFVRQFDMIPHIFRYALKGSYYAKMNVLRAAVRGMPGFVKELADRVIARIPASVINTIRKI